MKPIRVVLTQAMDTEELVFSKILVFVNEKPTENQVIIIIKEAIQLPENTKVLCYKKESENKIGEKSIHIELKYKDKEIKSFNINLFQNAFKSTADDYAINSNASYEQIKFGLEKLKAAIEEIENYAKQITEKRYTIEI